MTADNWVSVSKLNAVEVGEVIGVRAGDLDIALYNIEGRIYATHNICTHAHALLSDGWLEEDIIECPLHGGRFEVKTGKGLGAPITCDVRTLPVRVEDDVIQVNLA
jgi:nitrite reductase/ring-hydroxylating ferredoxin subunit